MIDVVSKGGGVLGGLIPNDCAGKEGRGESLVIHGPGQEEAEIVRRIRDIDHHVRKAVKEGLEPLVVTLPLKERMNGREKAGNELPVIGVTLNAHDEGPLHELGG